MSPASQGPVHVRICRECGEEYRPGITSCADCGGELEDRFLDDEALRPPTAPAGLEAETGPDLSQHRPVFVSGRAADLVPLAEELKEAGISFHLLESPAEEERRAASYSLLVHENDAARALRVLSPLLAPGEAAEGLPGLEGHFEEGRGYVRCPACGREQTAGAACCPDCGLALGAEGFACARCGSPLPEAVATCAACGAKGEG